MGFRTRRFPIRLVVFVLVLAAFAPVPTRAEVSFSLDASVGLVEGTASEYAFYYPYDRKFKLSELTWDIKDVMMAGVHGSMEFARRFRLNLGVWSALTEGGGAMLDRDWNYSDEDSAALKPNDRNWTDESRHPDTSLDEGTIVDVNLSVMALRAGRFELRGIVGYKHETWNWSARGGTYVYSTEYYGSRDLTGAFPAGVEVIAYEQRYSIPYIGVGASWAIPAFQVESHLLFSPLVSASDSDYHALRGVLFEGDFSGGTYVGLGLNATWAFAPHWSATLGGEYQAIPEMTGDTAVSGLEGSGYFSDGGGAALSAMSVTLGVGYSF